MSQSEPELEWRQKAEQKDEERIEEQEKRGKNWQEHRNKVTRGSKCKKRGRETE